MTKIWVLTFGLFLYAHLSDCQISHPSAQLEKLTGQYGVVVTLKHHQLLRFDDDLQVVVTHFSHKRPYIGGPTKATAYLTLSKKHASGEITLSVHGIQGKSESEDGLSDAERFDSVRWKTYQFHLKNFAYGESIRLVVYKDQ